MSTGNGAEGMPVVNERQASTASAYRARARARQKKLPTLFLPLPSETVFEVRRPNLQMYIVSGRMPDSLLTKAYDARKRKESPEDLMAKMRAEELLKMASFSREIVIKACVNPRIVVAVDGVEKIVIPAAEAKDAVVETVTAEEVELLHTTGVLLGEAYEAAKQTLKVTISHAVEAQPERVVAGEKILGVPIGGRDEETGLPFVRELNEEEITFEDLEQDDFEYILAWIIDGSEGIDVATKEGDVPMETLKRVGDDPGLSPGGGDSGDVGRAVESEVGNP